MSGKRTRALRAAFKAAFGKPPSTMLFPVDRFTRPTTIHKRDQAVALAGNQVRAWKKRVRMHGLAAAMDGAKEVRHAR